MLAGLDEGAAAVIGARTTEVAGTPGRIMTGLGLGGLEGVTGTHVAGCRRIALYCEVNPGRM